MAMRSKNDAAIVGYVASEGTARPRDIAVTLGLNPSSVSGALARLCACRVLEWTPDGYEYCGKHCEQGKQGASHE